MSDCAKLVDTSTKQYLFNTLTKCHDVRVKYYSIAFNVTVFVCMVVVTFGVLYFCYTTKLSQADTSTKNMNDQEYVLSKIRFYQEQQHRINAVSDITDLPVVPI